MTAYNFTSLQNGESPWIAGQVLTVGAYFNYASTTGAAGLVNADTITASDLLPAGGVKVLSVMVVGAEADTNASPTATFRLGDSLTDSDAAARYITGASMGTNIASGQFMQVQNVVPTLVDGVQTKGVGYVYNTNENDTNVGEIDLVLAVTAAVATAATSGVLYLYVTYACVGNA